MSMVNVISLEPIISPGRSSVLSGRADGAFAREHLRLSELEAEGADIEMSIPARVREMTPSFVLGMFSATFDRLAGNVVDREALERDFFSIYKFDASQQIVSDVISGIADYVDVRRSMAGFAALAGGSTLRS